VLEGDAGLSHYRLNEDAVRANQSFGHSEENEKSMVEHDLEDSEGDHLAHIACLLNERDLNIDLEKGKQLTRHRRYDNSAQKSPMVYR
jgi:hypothetical protein